MISTLPERKAVFGCTREEGSKAYPFQRGQRVLYENEEAEIIRVTPLVVLKTKNRVVCGALRNRFTCAMTADSYATV